MSQASLLLQIHSPDGRREARPPGEAGLQALPQRSGKSQKSHRFRRYFHVYVKSVTFDRG